MFSRATEEVTQVARQSSKCEITLKVSFVYHENATKTCFALHEHIKTVPQS